MSKARSLIIAPFDAAGQRVLDAVRRALAELDIEVFRFDDVPKGTLLTNAITDAVKSSDFLIVDISRRNPNVFYELGFAHALRKPTILLASSESDLPLPEALEGFQYVVYEPSNLRELVEHVKRAARTFATRDDQRP
jgi:nucleoside 2-deoxyribosyltransferase